MRVKYIVAYLLIVICFCGCGNSCPEYISHVENIIVQEPDSALAILDAFKEEIQQESQCTKMYYMLLYAEACERCFISNSYDSLLPAVTRYYEDSDEKDKLMKAYYFLGRRHLELNDKEDPSALMYSFRAMELADNSKDSSFIGRINNQFGKMFVNMNLPKEAIDKYHAAYSYFQSGDDKQASLDALCGMADVYCLLNESDSALYYYQKTYELAESVGILHKKEVDILQNLVKIYIKMGGYDEAKQLLSKIYNEVGENPKLGSIDKSNELNYNLDGILYKSMGKNDSAAIFFKRVLVNGDLDDIKYAYWNLFQLEKEHNYKEALNYLEKYAECSDSLHLQSNMKALQKIKSLYDLRLTEQEKEELRQENTKQRIWIIIVMVTLAAVIGVAIQYNRVKKEAARKQEEMLRNVYEEQYRKSQLYIDDNKQKIKELEERIDSIQQEKDALNKELLVVQKEKLEQTNQAVETFQKQQALLEEALRKSEIYACCYQAIENPTITFTATDWKQLQRAVDEAYDNFTSRLFVLHPSITTIELRICLLLKIRLPISTISQLVCRSQSAVSMSRKQLYKKLFHKEGVPANLDEFIFSF